MRGIVFKNVRKNYGAKEALRGVSFELKKGEILGFVGPNGAGKTTTIKLIAGLLKPSAGEVRVNNEDPFYNPDIALKNVGVLIEPQFFPYLTAYENLAFFCQLMGLPISQVKSLLSLIGLKEEADRKVGLFSFGMKQRLGLAQALLGNPDFLVLDEPNIGLDPIGLAELKGLLIAFAKEEERGILLSSHMLTLVEDICSNIILINEGKIIYSGALKGILEKKVFLVEAEPIAELVKILRIRGNKFYSPEEGKVVILAKEDEISDVLFAFKAFNGVLKNVKELPINLENIFTVLIKGEEPVGGNVSGRS